MIKIHENYQTFLLKIWFFGIVGANFVERNT
jgi:hypothetical protein